MILRFIFSLKMKLISRTLCGFIRWIGSRNEENQNYAWKLRWGFLFRFLEEIRENIIMLVILKNVLKSCNKGRTKYFEVSGHCLTWGFWEGLLRYSFYDGSTDPGLLHFLSHSSLHFSATFKKYLARPFCERRTDRRMNQYCFISSHKKI